MIMDLFCFDKSLIHMINQNHFQQKGNHKIFKQ
jgi:hypothetical protein